MLTRTDRTWYNPEELPGPTDASIDPEKIRGQYRPDDVLATVSLASWQSEEAFRSEWLSHRDDWEMDCGWAVKLDEFREVERKLISGPGAGVYYFIHQTHGPEVGLFARRLALEDTSLSNVGLIYSVERDIKVGLWRVDAGTRYFTQGEHVVLRKPR